MNPQPVTYPRPTFERGELGKRLFFDRYDAGRALGQRLRGRASVHMDSIVLALPRGGVAVADEVARALDAPLEVLTVCKIGAPQQRELAIGAITANGFHELDVDMIQRLRISGDDLRGLTKMMAAEARRRDSHYRHDRGPLDLFGRHAILVDDGAATGWSLRAAITLLRSMRFSSIVVALPVAPADTVAELESLVDDVVCLSTPERFESVGQWYVDFHQMTDREVCAVLDESPRSGEEVVH